VYFAAAIKTLDDAVEQEPFDGGGLDLTLNESATP